MSIEQQQGASGTENKDKNGISIVESRKGVTLNEKGQLIRTTPMGKSLGPLSKSEVLSIFAGNLGDIKTQQEGPEMQSLVNAVMLQEQIENRAQLATTLMVSGAAMKIAHDYDPDFDKLSLQEKFQSASMVMQQIVDIAITFEKGQTIVAEYDAQQKGLIAAAALVSPGFLNQLPALPKAERRILLSTIDELVRLAVVDAASRMPQDQLELGNQNLIIMEQGRAKAAEIKHRERAETEKLKAESQKVKDEANHARELSKLEREAAKREKDAATRRADAEHQQKLNIALADRNQQASQSEKEHEEQINKERWERFAKWWETLPSRALNGTVNFIFDENNGAVIRVVKSFSATIDHLASNTASMHIIGGALGGTVGLVGGALIGTSIVAANSAELGLGIANFIVDGSTIGLAVGGLSLGAYLGPNIIQGIKHTKDGIVELKDAIADKIDQWKQKRANKNSQGGPGSQTP